MTFIKPIATHIFALKKTQRIKINAFINIDNFLDIHDELGLKIESCNGVFYMENYERMNNVTFFLDEEAEQ